QVLRGVKGGGDIKRVFTKLLLNPSSDNLWRIPVHHTEDDAVFPYPSGFTAYFYRILIILKGGDKGERIKCMVFERHVVGVGQYQIPIKKMHALPEHKGGNIATAGFNAYFLPPAGKAGGSATKLQ